MRHYYFESKFPGKQIVQRIGENASEFQRSGGIP
jgi:hypothetical protein